MKELLIEAADLIADFIRTHPHTTAGDGDAWNDALVFRLHAAAARMEWVPVAERLPDEFPCDVWTLYGSGHVSMWRDLRCPHDVSVCFEGGNYTHWQYAIIPEPPKEGKS